MAPKIFLDRPWTDEGAGTSIPFLPVAQQGSNVFASTPEAGAAPMTPVKMPSALPKVFAEPTPPAQVSREPSSLEKQENVTEDKLRKLEWQDTHPFGSAENHPGVVGKILHGLSVAGQAAGNTFLPNVMATTQGTQLYRLGQERSLTDRLRDLTTARAQNEHTAAATDAENAMADYTRQRPDIEASKLDQKRQQAQVAAQQRAGGRGQVLIFDEDGNLLDIKDKPELQAFRVQQSTEFIHRANAEKAQIEAEIKQNGYVPGTPEYERAMKQIQQKDAQIAIARMNAGMRAEELEAHAHGTINGVELPGALHDEEGNPVGTWNAGNVKPTTQERDAAGRANSMTALQQRIEAAMQDPEVQEYMGPVGGRLAETQGELGTLPTKVAQFRNDLISYGAFQAGLHPVRGIGALQYFDKVMGGLAQTPEQLLGKLKSNADTAAAVQQTGEMPTTEGNKRKQTAPNGPPVPAEKGRGRKAMLNGKEIEVRGGKWVYSDTGKAVE